MRNLPTLAAIICFLGAVVLVMVIKGGHRPAVDPPKLTPSTYQLVCAHRELHAPTCGGV